MDDINRIREELKGHVNVELPYIFPYNCHIKYLTLRDEQELFYRGGQFCCHKGNKITLTLCGKQWSVPIDIKDRDGDTIYTTTFFIEEDSEECSKDDKKKDEIIISQQKIIKKLTHKLKELEYQLIMNDS